MCSSISVLCLIFVSSKLFIYIPMKFLGFPGYVTDSSFKNIKSIRDPADLRIVAGSTCLNVIIIENNIVSMIIDHRFQNMIYACGY